MRTSDDGAAQVRLGVGHSRSYGLREDQAQARLGKPAPKEAASDAQIVTNAGMK